MKTILYPLIIVFICSCTSQKQEETAVILQKQETNISVKHAPITKVEEQFLEETEKWEEYNNVKDFTSKFINTTPNEALSNALEFKTLVNKLKVSLKPKLFQLKSFEARINILNNEAERFADITFIPAIKTNEINLQVDKILNAFSALNSKINTILSQKKFEKEIVIDAVFIGLDSTKIDSVSQKSIQNLEKEINKKKLITRNSKTTKKRKEFKSLKPFKKQ